MTERATPSSPNPAERKGQFLLVVDSNPRDALYTGTLLQNFGYTVHTVHTAEEAAEFLGIAVPALVITELALPRMSGADLLKHIRQRQHTSATPVIIQTAIEDVETRDQCMLEGCTIFLKKPVKAEDLFKAVQTAIEATPRQNIRIHTYLKAMIGGPASAGTEAEYVTVLSESGMYVKTLQPRPVQTRAPVSFVVKDRTMTLDALVLYSFSFGQGPFREPGMGMKFVGISPEDRALLREFISEEFAKGIGQLPRAG